MAVSATPLQRDMRLLHGVFKAFALDLLQHLELLYGLVTRAPMTVTASRSDELEATRRTHTRAARLDGDSR